MAADPFDAVLDARSEQRYEADASAEPTQDELEPVFVCVVDESGGLRGDTRG